MKSEEIFNLITDKLISKHEQIDVYQSTGELITEIGSSYLCGISFWCSP